MLRACMALEAVYSETFVIPKYRNEQKKKFSSEHRASQKDDDRERQDLSPGPVKQTNCSDESKRRVLTFARDASSLLSTAVSSFSSASASGES